MQLTTVLTLTSSTFFFAYGILCLRSDLMKREFKRFNLEKFRTLTGTLECLGALGLLVGFYLKPIAILSSGGLALLMFCGACVRLKIKDSFAKTSPAILFAIVNIYLFIKCIEN